MAKLLAQVAYPTTFYVTLDVELLFFALFSGKRGVFL